EKTHSTHLCYPSISKIPEEIEKSAIKTCLNDFTRRDLISVLAQCVFIYRNRIKCIYFSDQAALSWRYILFRMAGVRKIIVHDHTPGLRTPPRGFKRTAKSLLMRMPWITANAIFGATRFVQQRTIEVTRVPPDKTFCVPNGIKIAAQSYAPADLTTLFNIPKNQLVMASTGRAHHYK